MDVTSEGRFDNFDAIPSTKKSVTKNLPEFEPRQAGSKAGVAFVTAEVWSYLLAGFIYHIWMFPKIELPSNHPF